MRFIKMFQEDPEHLEKCVAFAALQNLHFNSREMNRYLFNHFAARVHELGVLFSCQGLVDIAIKITGEYSLPESAAGPKTEIPTSAEGQLLTEHATDSHGPDGKSGPAEYQNVSPSEDIPRSSAARVRNPNRFRRQEQAIYKGPSKPKPITTTRETQTAPHNTQPSLESCSKKQIEATEEQKESQTGVI